MAANLKILTVIGHKISLCTCKNLILLIIPYIMFFTDCIGQTTVKLTQPQLTLINDSLIIKYSILGATPKDIFDIRLEITDNTGAKIKAVNITGDIGDDVKGGLNKQIIWNLTADKIFLSTNINVEVIAKKVIIPAVIAQEKDLAEIPSDQSKEDKDLAEIPAGTNNKETTEDTKESHKTIEESALTGAKIKTGKHLLQSAIFPGWGLTKLSNGKPYWLIGVAGAGCIASSIYFNQQAFSNYNNYLESNDKEKFDTYFDNAKTQDNLSKAFAYTAAAIWVTDLVIVGIKAHSINKSYRRGRFSAFSVSSCIDSKTDTPMLILYFNF